MTPAQREALQWAIKEAQDKATIRRRTASASRTALGERLSREDAYRFDGIARELKAVLEGESNA